MHDPTRDNRRKTEYDEDLRLMWRAGVPPAEMYRQLLKQGAAISHQTICSRVREFAREGLRKEK